MKYLFFAFFISLSLYLSAQNKDVMAIRKVLATQQDAWNKGDLKGFMQGYWHSDSLMFIGKSGPKYGWQNTLDGYITGYPDAAAMGKLTFDIIKVETIDKKAAFVVGKWHLTRTIGDVGGCFTLFWKKIKGEWVIVADHSS